MVSREKEDPTARAGPAGASEEPTRTSESVAGSATKSDSPKLRTEEGASQVFNGAFADTNKNLDKAVKEPVQGAVKLANISNREIDEGKQLEFDVRTESAKGDFRFAFSGKPPRGAQLDAGTGRFQWKPNETQGPGTYKFSVKVTAGFGGVLDETNFEIRVREVNSPPRIVNPRIDRVDVGKDLHIQLKARDSDRPENTFTFELEDAPRWARVDQRTGKLLLAPPTGTNSSWQSISVLVRDSGTPPQTSRETYTFPVLAPPILRPHEPKIAIGAEDHVRGRPNAPITIVLQLTHPENEDERLVKQLYYRIYQTVIGVVQTKGTKVNVVFRPYAYDWYCSKKIGPASECVFELGGNKAYWEFLDAVYSTPASEDVDFAKCAAKAGISPNTFRDSMEDESFMEKCLDRYYGRNFNSQYSLVSSDSSGDVPFLTAALDTQSFTIVGLQSEDDDNDFWFPLTFLDNRSASAKIGPRTGLGYYYSGEINTEILEKLVEDLYKNPSR